MNHAEIRKIVTDAICHLTLSVQGLSALVYGSLSIDEVIHRGWAIGTSEAERHLLAHWFPPLLAFNLNSF